MDEFEFQAEIERRARILDELAEENEGFIRNAIKHCARIVRAGERTSTVS